MKKIKERTYTKKFIEFIGGIGIGYFFYLMIFAIFFTAESEELTDSQLRIAVILSFLTMILYQIICEFNYLKRLELTTKTLHSNISIYKKREIKLIEKAEKVIVEFQNHESNLHKSVASLRSGKTNFKQQKIFNSTKDFIVSVENYPELKSNKHITRILSQIEESQNSIASSKLLYNDYVTYYNSAIVSFPAMLFSGLWKLQPLNLYIDDDIE